jgi:hypothetical protein
MPMELTVAQVLSLAPDAGSVAAGKKLAKPGPWKGLGHDATALWGECQGSALYQTQVALSDLASKCSCPSRKFPCKHALGLLLLAAEAPQAISAASAPEWVTSWLEKRGAAQQKKIARAEAPAKPVDAAAQAKRAEKRQESVLAGLDQLDAWMNDLVRQGLSRVQSESPGLWLAQSKRLVDAQAPGLASRIRQMGARVGTRGEWAPRLLDDLGQLALLTEAYRRADELEPSLAADVRRIVGHTLEHAEVIAHGDVVDDEWDVMGEVVEDDERVRVQRAWLRGKESGRTALVLQFAVGGARFAEAIVVGTRQRARLAFWPSAAPERALVVGRSGSPESVGGAPDGVGIHEALTGFTGLLARSPWVEQSLFVLGGVTPVPGEPWMVSDMQGDSLPLRGTSEGLLLAVSGGHPISLAGEWDGYALRPMSAWVEGRLLSLVRTAA